MTSVRKLIAVAGCGVSFAVLPVAARADWPVVGSFGGPLGPAEIAVGARGGQAVLVRVPGGNLRLARRAAGGGAFSAPTPLGRPVPNTRTDLAISGDRVFVLSADRVRGLALRSLSADPADARIATTGLSTQVVTSASMTVTAGGLVVLAATCPRATSDITLTRACRDGRLTLYEYDTADKTLHGRVVASGGTFGPVALTGDGQRRVAAIWARRTTGKRFSVVAAHITGPAIMHAVRIGASSSPVQVTASIAASGATLAGWVDVRGSECGPSTPTSFFLASGSVQRFSHAHRFAVWDDEQCGGGVNGLGLALQAFGSGTGRVIWTDRPQSTYAVLAAPVDHGVVGAHQRLSTPGVNSQLLSVAARSDGTLGVLWCDEQTGPTNEQALYASELPPAASHGAQPAAQLITTALEGPTASLAWTPNGKLATALQANLEIQERLQP